MSRFLSRLHMGWRLRLLASEKEVELKLKIFGLALFELELSMRHVRFLAPARTAGALLLSGMQRGAEAMVFLSMGHVTVMLSNGKAQLRSSPAAILEDN